MSEIKVDTLTGKTSAGNITVTSEGGAATMQLQQGLAKAWSNHSNLSSVGIHDSMNISSMVDVSLSVTRVSYTNAFNNAVYSGSGTCVSNRMVKWRSYNTHYLSTSNEIITHDHNANGGDSDYIGVQFYGDLA